MKSLLSLYLKPMIDANIDYLVLGCTHYPYLMPLLIDMLPKNVKIIDSGEAVAKQTKAILEQNNLLNTASTKTKNQFFTNGDVVVLDDILNHNFNVSYLKF